MYIISTNELSVGCICAYPLRFAIVRVPAVKLSVAICHMKRGSAMYRTF